MTTAINNTLELSYKQTIADDYLSDDITTELLYGGAAGGGKSFYGCAWQLMRRYMYPTTRGLIGRSRLTNLKKTTLKTFFEVYKNYFQKLPNFEMKYIGNPVNEIRFSNGSEIILKDLFWYPSDKNLDAFGSLELTDVFVDELAEVHEKVFNILCSRIRYKLGMVGGVPKALASCNPAHNWVKFRFVMDKKGNPVKLKDYQKYIAAKVSDNPDAEFKRLYTQQLEKMPLAERRRLLHGDWGYVENEKPFFYAFDRNKHVVSEKFHLRDMELVWKSFDFNITPTTVIISQKVDGVGLFFFAVHQKDGGTTALCKSIKHDYKNFLLNVTGDRSGHSGNSAAGMLPGGQYNTDYAQIKAIFGLTDAQLFETYKANKAHEYSRRLCNTVLERIPVFINPDCHMLISDLETAQPTVSGKLLKDRDQHKQDVGDAFRYQINAWFPKGMKDVNRFCNLLTG